MKKRLLWQLYPSYLLLTVVAVLAVAWYSSHSLRRFYYRQVSEDLRSRAQLVRQKMTADLISRDFEKIDRLCKQTGPRSSTRITVILPDGRVIGDSDEEVSKMKNHADRPEFRDAITNNLGQCLRFSKTLDKNMSYLAIPIRRENEILAVLRTSVPAAAIDEQLGEIYHRIFWAVGIVAAIAAVISLHLSKRISQPIEQIKDAAGRFAAGDMTGRLAVSKPDELAQLAEAMNQMAHQLDERINTITTQNSESDAILSSMIEGVIAIDSNGRIVRINRAAAAMLNADVKQARRRLIEEVISNADIMRFAQQALDAPSPTETEVVMMDNENRRLKLHAAPMKNAADEKNGAVIVLSDITRIKQLEKMRRDFVANVSHELKTPITSIKGFVETLLEGALSEPQQGRRFLEIIGKHANRLNAIIDDLFCLSRLEESGEKRAFSFDILPLAPVLAEAVELSGVRAQEKHIEITLDCDEDLRAQINPALLEQAVTNLVNNAVEYSPAESTVEVGACRDENEIRIEVRDSGCGISEKHQERIFERFYVADKSRSRKAGGTGLGLAIVKHIAQVHNGRISVNSQPGRGSCFTLTLPVVP